MAFLDTAGVERLWQHILAKIGTKADASSLESGDIIVAEAVHATSADLATTATSMHGVTASSSDGVSYTATVDGITELVSGINFIMVPDKMSTSVQTKLNVNSLGEKSLRVRVSNSTATTTAPASTNWLAANKPVEVFYDGTFWVANLIRPNVNDLYGTVKVEQGGTGATDAATAVTNLGGLSVVVSSTEPTNDNCAIWIKTS